MAALYVTGFLIVSLHHWQFGIAQLEVLKPKVLAAGLTFFVLTGAAWVVNRLAANIAILQQPQVDSVRHVDGDAHKLVRRRVLLALIDRDTGRLKATC